MRDARSAFLRLTSGRFTRGMKLKAQNTGKAMSVNAPIMFFASDRELADDAFAGDVVGMVQCVNGIMEPLPRIEHALTHLDWVLHTLRGPAPLEAPEGTWVAWANLHRYALPAPLKKLLDSAA